MVVSERYQIAVTMTVDAESEEAALADVGERLCLAEGQGLLSRPDETLVAWSVHGVVDEETWWTACERCGRLNIEIVDDSAPELCRSCDG